MALAPQAITGALAAFEASGFPASVVGEVVPGEGVEVVAGGGQALLR